MNWFFASGSGLVEWKEVRLGVGRVYGGEVWLVRIRCDLRVEDGGCRVV